MTSVGKTDDIAASSTNGKEEVARKLGYEDFLPHLGNFGHYQKRIYFLLCLPIILCGLNMFVGVFLLATPDHRCALPGELQTHSYNLTNDVWKKHYPMDHLTHQYSKCTYYKNFTHSTKMLSHHKHEALKCDEWIYDDTKFKRNVVTEWNLVCGKSFLRATANSLLLFGDLLGSVFFGQLSDKIGRKPVFFMCLTIQCLSGILSGFAPEYFTFILCKIIIGAASNGVFLASYIISIEMVGPQIRLYASEIFMMFFSCGYMLTAAFNYYIDDWRMIQIAISAPTALFLIYWWFIPESARWLIARNRHAEAGAIIQKAVDVNKAVVPEEIMNKLKNAQLQGESGKQDIEKASILDLFRYPNMRKRSLLIFANFFFISITYYGLSWNTNSLGDNHYTNFIISGAVEIPAYAFDLLTLNRYGRRTILPCCMIVSGSALLLTSVIPSNMEWLIVLLAMIGKTAITSSYGTIFILANEQFPTVIRNVGLGACLLAARIGGISAPYLILLSDIWKPLPMVIFGILTLIGGINARMLPETLNKELPETLEQAENFGFEDDE